METKYGWPIVTAANCFDVVRDLGIRPWAQTQEPAPLLEYLEPDIQQFPTPESFTTEKIRRRALVDRFAPRTEVVHHRNPRDRSYFEGFRTVQRPAVCVFGLIEDLYVPITAEWKHGNGLITLVPPAGVPGKAEEGLPIEEQMIRTALREWQEETGIERTDVVPLGHCWTTVRNAWMVYYEYLAVLRDFKPVQGPTKLDDTEHLKILLFPLEEWLTLLFQQRGIPEDFGIELVARDVTFSALHHLGRLRLG